MEDHYYVFSYNIVGLLMIREGFGVKSVRNRAHLLLTGVHGKIWDFRSRNGVAKETKCKRKKKCGESVMEYADVVVD